MSNNDKFIRDTEFGKLMEIKGKFGCKKCKYNKMDECTMFTDYLCVSSDKYYFAKDETEEETDGK